jgi:hypothetical protein
MASNSSSFLSLDLVARALYVFPASRVPGRRPKPGNKREIRMLGADLELSGGLTRFASCKCRRHFHRTSQGLLEARGRIAARIASTMPRRDGCEQQEFLVTELWSARLQLGQRHPLRFRAQLACAASTGSPATAVCGATTYPRGSPRSSASDPHSHSMVAGGFPEMSYTMREMPFTSFTMRRKHTSRKSCGSRARRSSGARSGGAERGLDREG